MNKDNIERLGDVASRLQVNPDFKVFVEYFQRELDKNISHMTSGACADMANYMATSRACIELEKVTGFCDRFIERSSKLANKGE